MTSLSAYIYRQTSKMYRQNSEKALLGGNCPPPPPPPSGYASAAALLVADARRGPFFSFFFFACQLSSARPVQKIVPRALHPDGIYTLKSTKIHVIKINNIWIQIIQFFNKNIWKTQHFLASKRRNMRLKHKRSFFENHRTAQRASWGGGGGVGLGNAPVKWLR